ncbi:hypothetical protein J6590_062558 [Homalodisca vitripennis]|nr:hypothetical protein J6590_062558 [Homalodisca vitripennis]
MHVSAGLEASEAGRPYDAVDSEVIQKARDFQEAIMPLPGYVINFMMKTTASLYLPIKADLGLCRSHSQYTLHSVLKSEMWALRMIDASSKVPTGLLEGCIQDLGNYDQCLRVEEPEQRFTGQHCLVDARGLLPDRLETYFKDMLGGTARQVCCVEREQDWPQVTALRHTSSSASNPVTQQIALPETPRSAWFEDYPWGYITFSLCVPSSCDSKDIITHLNNVLGATGLNMSMAKFDVFCSSDGPRSFRTKDWVAV